MNTPDEAALLAAELLARRWLPRQHPKVKRALVDADLWQAVQDRLAQVGLRLVDNIHADNVTTAMVRTVEHAVFGEAALNSHNNIDLPRDAVSLLVVLWSLIVLPKRERQAARDVSAEGDLQDEMFSAERRRVRQSNGFIQGTAGRLWRAAGQEDAIGRQPEAPGEPWIHRPKGGGHWRRPFARPSA